MAQKKELINESADRELEKRNDSGNGVDKKLVMITRIYDAPRELVFKAWTDPEHLAHWYAPKGCTVHFAKIDVRPGGGFHSCIRSSDNHECWCVGVYQEIVYPSLIVFTLAIADEKGNLVEPREVGMDPDWPKETIVVVMFTEYEGKTKLTLHQTVLESVAKRTGAHPSWVEMLDFLALDLAKTNFRLKTQR